MKFFNFIVNVYSSFVDFVINTFFYNPLVTFLVFIFLICSFALLYYYFSDKYS